MSLIEEALRRVQETAPAHAESVATIVAEPAPQPIEAVEIPASRPRAFSGSIPPVLPTPITVGGITAAVVSVAILIAVSALTLRHSSRSVTRPAPSGAASARPEPVAAPKPVEPEPAPAAAVVAAPIIAKAPEVKAASTTPSAGDPVSAVPGFGAPQFILNGIARGGGDEPVAIINGKILKVGETIEGATLAEILPDAARLRWPDRELIIRITR